MVLSRGSEKYNESCIIIFELLKLLSNGEADYQDVIKIFSKTKENEKSNSQVVLNKYLNTLKIFGIKIKKSKNKYVLLNSPYKIELSKEDLTAISLLKSAAELLVNEKSKDSFTQLINLLELRYNENTKNIPGFSTNEENLKKFFYPIELSEQIKRCEQCCQDKYKLHITFINNKNKEEQLNFCSPVEVKYHKRKICLQVYTHNNGQVVEIPIDNIKLMKQLPSIASSNHLSTTVVFKLRNKLVKNYKLREWERSDGLDSNGDLIIINNNEDFDMLLRRLIRYGDNCVIISPKFLKEAMIELINETLRNYD